MWNLFANVLKNVIHLRVLIITVGTRLKKVLINLATNSTEATECLPVN